MQDNKLLKILSTFSEQEFRRFKKMLQSPYFTSNGNLLNLYAYLKTYYPNFDSPKLAKKQVFRKLFPDHVYSDIKLRNLFREMTRLAEHFLLEAMLQKENTTKGQLLLRAYGQRQLSDLFDREAKLIRTALEKSAFEDIEVFASRYELSLQRLEVLPSKALVDRFQLLLETASQLEHHFQLSKAKIKAELESFRGILSSQQTKDIQEETKVDLQQNLLYALYQQITQLYQTSDLTIFEKVKNQLMNHIDQIRPSLQVELLTHLLNFTIRQMKEDDRKFNQLAFELYRFGMDKNILIQNGQLHDSAYLNIAVIASKAKAFDWTKNFMEQYDQYVPDAFRQDVKTLAYANWLFHQALFSDAIDGLGLHAFTHPLYNITARTHALRCYYELFLQDGTYYDLLIAQCQAFEKFVRRSSVYSEATYNACLNFVKMLTSLTKFQTGKKISLANQKLLIKKLKEQEHTVSRSWLLEKIQQ